MPAAELTPVLEIISKNCVAAAAAKTTTTAKAATTKKAAAATHTAIAGAPPFRYLRGWGDSAHAIYRGQCVQFIGEKLDTDSSLLHELQR